MSTIEIGDIIRDIEDGDCYYEGVVVELNPIKYKVTHVIWIGENDDSMNGNVTELQWWRLEKQENGKWIPINNY